MLFDNLPTFLQKCKDLVDQAAYWAARSRHWALVALTGVGIVEVEAGTTELTVGTEQDIFTYFIVNDDLHTVTFYLLSTSAKGTSFQIRNNGFGVVQVQALDGGIISSSGTLQLRGNGSVVSLICTRTASKTQPAAWDLVGDVLPL